MNEKMNPPKTIMIDGEMRYYDEELDGYTAEPPEEPKSTTEHKKDKKPHRFAKAVGKYAVIGGVGMIAFSGGYIHGHMTGEELISIKEIPPDELQNNAIEDLQDKFTKGL